MVVLLEGKTRIRDLIDGDKEKGQVGTGTTAATEDDTGLETPVAATDISLTSSTAEKTLVLNYNLGSTLGNGNSITEFVARLNSGNTDFSRNVFASISKTSSIELQFSKIFFIV